MKLRPVVLVLLILFGFYYLSTRLAPTGAMAGFVHRVQDGVTGSPSSVPVSNFTLTEASAAPAFYPEELQNISVYKRALPAVVNITSNAVVCCDFFLRPVPQQGQGSGFIVSSQGLIVTNNHVIDNAQTVEVTLSNKKKYKATVIGADRIHDIALLQIHGAADLQPAILAQTSTNLVVGQEVYAIGNPFGFNGTMTRGIISALRAVQLPSGSRIEDAIQTDASVNPGNSGGPLLNSRGEVIGITTMIASNPNGGADQSAGTRFAIPITTVKAVLDDFAKFGRARRPSLDVLTYPIDPGLAEQIGLAADNGLLIQRVLPGGAAERAGLRGGSQIAYVGNTEVRLGGDLIVGIDDHEVANAQDLSIALNAHRAGDTVSVTVYRGRQRMTVKVTLTDAKQVIGGQET